MSIAAVVLGGTLLSGGKGSIVGTLAGVGIFAVLDNVMGVMELNPFLKDVVRGIVIVVAVAVYARREIDRRPARFGAQPAEVVRMSATASACPARCTRAAPGRRFLAVLATPGWRRLPAGLACSWRSWCPTRTSPTATR